MATSNQKGKLLPHLLPLLVVERRVLLPGASLSVTVDDPRGMHLVETQLWNEENWSGKYLGVVSKPSRDSEMHGIGTAASVRRVTGSSSPLPHFSLLLIGLCRFKIEEMKSESPYPVASITQLDPINPASALPPALKSQAVEFRSAADQFLQLLKLDNATVKRILGALPDHKLPDFLTSLVNSTFEEKLDVLDAVNLGDRFNLSLPLLQRQVSLLKALRNAPLLEEEEGDRDRGEGILIPRGNARRHKGPSGGGRGMGMLPSMDEDELEDLEKQLNSAHLPDHALKVAQKELKRLGTLPVQFPEHAQSRTYLETLLGLPWACATTDQLDLIEARANLERDHYGLDKVKKRVLEFLAVRKLKNSLQGPILCFIGAPGVGKTSIGRSIAHSLGRKFHRISLGGISDQADIRGHRRTYIGAMPGRVVQGLKTVGVNNPVFLLDEVDKLYHGLHGNPAAALLEVLDQEQNNTFVDHYLNVPFDLSQVLFIATANTSSKIPSALLDRMEVIDIPGYTEEEKVEIAKRHLLPKQLEQHGLDGHKLQVPSAMLAHIVTSYTAEAGVRGFERMLGALCRAAALKVAGDEVITLPIVVTMEIIEDTLGVPKYSHEVSERLTRPGVAVGLAWTALGGEIMFIEASKIGGSGELILTGQLGAVMKESAQIALNWVRSNSKQYGWSCDVMDQLDVHLHFPAGGVGKDGPSAGVGVVVALVSLFAGKCVRSDTALTGEVTLRGLVLPVGGIKEKIIAAHRAGLTRVVLPSKNKKDLAELSPIIKDAITFLLVENCEEVLTQAFEAGIPRTLKSRL